MAKDTIGYLKYGKHKFCYKCLREMIEEYRSFPNDGTLLGCKIAIDISKGKFKCKHLIKKNKKG